MYYRGIQAERMIAETNAVFKESQETLLLSISLRISSCRHCLAIEGHFHIRNKDRQLWLIVVHPVLESSYVLPCQCCLVVKLFVLQRKVIWFFLQRPLWPHCSMGALQWFPLPHCGTVLRAIPFYYDFLLPLVSMRLAPFSSSMVFCAKLGCVFWSSCLSATIASTLEFKSSIKSSQINYQSSVIRWNSE